MGIVLGVDIGISTTKIVGFHGKRHLKMLQVQTAESSDLISSLQLEIDGLLRGHSLDTSQVTDIYMTGVGASFVTERVCDTDVQKIDEFTAMRNGALKLSGLNEALVVSMGTGTAFVRATREQAVHIGGTGVGGGTVLGLASKLLDIKYDIEDVLSLAERGDLKKVDLLVGDVLRDAAGTLLPDLTASNFGKQRSDASTSDVVLGIINMVFETIGMMAILALQKDTADDIVLIGSLAAIPQAKHIFDRFTKLTGKNFIILPDAAFVTALGTLPVTAPVHVRVQQESG